MEASVGRIGTMVGFVLVTVAGFGADAAGKTIDACRSGADAGVGNLLTIDLDTGERSELVRVTTE